MSVKNATRRTGSAGSRGTGGQSSPPHLRRSATPSQVRDPQHAAPSVLFAKETRTIIQPRAHVPFEANAHWSALCSRSRKTPRARVRCPNSHCPAQAATHTRRSMPIRLRCCHLASASDHRDCSYAQRSDCPSRKRKEGPADSSWRSGFRRHFANGLPSVASDVAGSASRRPQVPPVVRTPATSIESLIENGTPCSGPRTRPCAKSDPRSRPPAALRSENLNCCIQ